MAEPNTAEKEAKVEAAFGSAFNGAPPEAIPPAKVVEEPAADPVVPVAVVPAPAPKPEYVRVTKQERDNDKAAIGKIPALESALAKLRGELPNAERIVQQVIEKVQAQTPAGMNVEITDEDLAEMAADFPEVAKSTRAALEKIFKKVNVKGTGAAPEPVDMEAEVEKVLLTRESKALARTYPDWSEIVGRPPAEGTPIDEANPFRQWLAKQPADYQKEVGETNSPAEVQAAIAKFKADQTTATPAPAAQPDKAAARRAVIADALTPRAEGGAPPLNHPESAEDAFAKGFKVGKPH